LLAALLLVALWGPVDWAVAGVRAAQGLRSHGGALYSALRAEGGQPDIDDVRGARASLTTAEAGRARRNPGGGPVAGGGGQQAVLGHWADLAVMIAEGPAALAELADAGWWVTLRLQSALESYGQTNTASGVAVAMDTEPLVAVGEGLRQSRDGLLRARAHLAGLAEAAERLNPDDTRVGRALAATPWLADALLAAPRLWKTRDGATWLVLIQNNDELRATGGFISSVAVVTLAQGRVADLRTMNSYDVDTYREEHPDPPEALARYMDAGMLLFRDANWSPDFPSSAAVLASIYAQDMQEPVDGVIAVDGVTAQLMVAALGSLQEPGYDVQVTAESVLSDVVAYWEDPQGATSLAERQNDFMDWLEHRKDFGAVLITAFRERLAVASPGDWLALAGALDQAAKGKHLLAWPLDDIRLQDDQRRMGLAGDLSRAPGDYLMVVDSNVGWNKADRNISRGIGYRVDLSKAAPVAELCLTYRHHAPAQEEACDHRADYADSYQAMTEQCYWDYWRVYVPAGAELLSYAGGEGGVEADQEAGRTVFGGLLLVRPGETGMICLRYRLPEGTAICDEGICTYRLTLQKQPGAGAAAVDLVLAAGGRWQRLTPWCDDGQGTAWRSDRLSGDQEYQLSWSTGG
jgi:hypothetical protein